MEGNSCPNQGGLQSLIPWKHETEFDRRNSKVCGWQENLDDFVRVIITWLEAHALPTLFNLVVRYSFFTPAYHSYLGDIIFPLRACPFLCP